MGAGPTQMAGHVIPQLLQSMQQDGRFSGPNKGPLFTPPGPAVRPMGPDKGPLFVPPGPATRPMGPDKGPLFVPPGPAVRPDPQNDVMRQPGLLGAFNPPRYF